MTAANQAINKTDDMGRALKEMDIVLDDLARELQPFSEFDNLTLYRGTSGTENAGNVVFLTDNIKVAQSYVKNGGEVVKYDLSKVGIERLYFSQKVEKLTGKHTSTGATNTEYLFRGAELKQILNSLAKPID